MPAGRYTISLKIVSGTIVAANDFDGIMCAINKSDYAQRTPGVFNVGETKSRSFTLEKDTLISTFDIIPSYGGEGTVFTDVVVACQLERNDAATEFEPYKCSYAKLSKPIELYGIEVFDMSLANCIDADGKMWCCDEIDAKRNLLVQRIKKYVLSGGVSWRLNNSATSLYNSGLLNDAKPIEKNRLMGMCNKVVQTNNNCLSSEYVIRVNVDKGLQFVNVAEQLGIECTSDAFNAYLAENPFEFYYQLATPIETPMCAEDKIALRSMKSYDGVTYVLTDSEVRPEVEVEYGKTYVAALTIENGNLSEVNSLLMENSVTKNDVYVENNKLVIGWL